MAEKVAAQSFVQDTGRYAAINMADGMSKPAGPMWLLWVHSSPWALKWPGRWRMPFHRKKTGKHRLPAQTIFVAAAANAFQSRAIFAMIAGRRLFLVSSREIVFAPSAVKW